MVHIYGPDELRSLASRLATALAPGGLLIIRDFLFDGPDHTAPASAALFALNMLINTETGGCYSAAELEEMFTPAGFGGWRTSALDERTWAVTATLDRGSGAETAP